MCDRMLHELAGAHSVLNTGARYGQPTVDDMLRDSTINPSGRQLDDTEMLSLTAALAPLEQERSRAAYRSEMVKWTTLKELISRGQYVRVDSTDSKSFDALVQQKNLEYQTRTGARSGLNVMVTGIAGARAGESRLIVFERGGQGGSYLDAMDELQRIAERRKTLVRDFLSGLPPK